MMSKKNARNIIMKLPYLGECGKTRGNAECGCLKLVQGRVAQQQIRRRYSDIVSDLGRQKGTEFLLSMMILETGRQQFAYLVPWIGQTFRLCYKQFMKLFNITHLERLQKIKKTALLDNGKKEATP